MKKALIAFVLLAALTVAGYLFVESWIVDYRDQAFRADSAAAAADTARLLALEALDSTENAYQRRIVQVELERDSLDEELELRPVIRLPGELRMDTLRLVDTVPIPVIEHDTVRVYGFQGTDGPFDFIGEGRIFPSGRGIFDVSVGMNRGIQVGALVSCGSEDGIRSAHVLLTAEDPFHIVPMDVQQDRNVCNPPVKFNLLPEISFRGIGWELVKGAGWMLLANQLDDGFRKAKY